MQLSLPFTLLVLTLTTPSLALEHVARKGENIASIMRTYGVEPVWGGGNSVDQVLGANGEMLRQFPNSIEVGQVIIIPDHLIDGVSTATDDTLEMTITTKDSKKIEIDFLSPLEKEEIAQKDAKIDETLAALDASYSKTEPTAVNQPESTSIDVAIEESLVEPETAETSELRNDAVIEIVEKDDEAPIDGTAEEELKENGQSPIANKKLVKESIETPVSSKMNMALQKMMKNMKNPIQAELTFSPLLSRMTLKGMINKKETQIKSGAGKGAGVSVNSKIFKKLATRIEYVYQKFEIEDTDDYKVKQRSKTLQRFGLGLGLGVSDSLTVMAESAMTESFVIFEQNNELVVSNSWSPLLGMKLALHSDENSYATRWQVAVGAQHIPRQQINDVVRKWGSRNYAEASVRTMVDINSFFSMSIMYSELQQYLDLDIQKTEESHLAIGYGTRF